MELKEAIARWKELNIDRAVLTFDCGGDSMGGMEWSLYDNEDEHVVDNGLVNYFDNIIYEKVDFYVNSDGHYMGESGTVTIELSYEDEEDEDFVYNKDAVSNYEETVTNELVVELTDVELAFVKEYVRDINGGYVESVNFNYSKDFIMTDEMDVLERLIGDKVSNAAAEFTPEKYDGELNEWYRYDSGEENDTIVIKDNSIVLTIFNSVYTERPSDW
jgi:hypothetical protein